MSFKNQVCIIYQFSGDDKRNYFYPNGAVESAAGIAMSGKTRLDYVICASVRETGLLQAKPFKSAFEKSLETSDDLKDSWHQL